MKLKSTPLFVLSLTVMLLFVSCQSETESTIATSPATTVTSAATSQSSLVSTTPAPLPTVTATIQVEMMADPVFDLIASPTFAPEIATLPPTLAALTIVAITLTPLPTFAADELETAMVELLANPMNCDVPCWWGATPSETTIFEVQQFLALYHFTDYKSDDPDHISLRIGYDENDNQLYFPVRYSFENHLLKIVYAGQLLPLYEILKRYNQPDEVWLSTVSFVREGDLFVRLNMIYLQKGMAVGYVVNGTLQNDTVTGCFADEVGRLRLNVPNSSTSYKDFSTIFEEDRHYLLLEESTGLTMDDFMQRFSDPTQPQCVETPTELWE